MIHPVRLDADHRYWLPDGSEVPGFSHIVKTLALTPENKFYTAAGREEGVSLHSWLFFLASGRVPSTPPDPRIAGRVDGIRKFLMDTGFKFAGGETPLYEPRRRYACTPDIWGTIGNWTWVIDGKRGGKLTTHALQTAAQKLALRENGFHAQKRGSLYLKDGFYRLDEHHSPDDMTRWTAHVAEYHRRHK